jgi:hypothetical protein
MAVTLTRILVRNNELGGDQEASRPAAGPGLPDLLGVIRVLHPEAPASPRR